MRNTRLGTAILPEFPWSHERLLWSRAEELGLAHAWTYDHLSWQMLRDSPWFGAVTTLTAAAAVTDRIRLGPLVSSPNFRHPVPFAKELMRLDDVSDGRLVLGIGAGGVGWDATTLGHPPWSVQERTERFDEFVDLLDRLLRERVTSYEGRYYSADGARMYPGCVQQPRVPFAIAATGPRGMRLAATHAAKWVTTGDRVAPTPVPAAAGARMIAAQMAALDEVCATVGRDPATLDRLVLVGPQLDTGLGSAGAFDEVCGEYAAVGVTDLVVPWPRPSEPYAGDVTVFEKIVAERAGTAD